MALVKLQPSSGALSIANTLPEVLAKPNESTFTSLYPESKVGSLLKYVEGYPWTVHYYGQILNSSNTVDHVDPSIPHLNQPYYEVKDAIIQVSSALSTAYDQSTGVTSVNGAALVPFKLTPNVGDLFIAQVDTAEDAIFIITSVQRKTHRKDTLYEIDYSLYQYTSVNPDFIVQLQQKVQDSYHFNKDSQYFNRDALISPMEFKAVSELKHLLSESQSFYFDKFYKRQAGTILLPGVLDRVYDTYLMSFISKTVSHDVINPGGMFQLSQFDRYIKQPVFWELLLTKSLRKANTINRKVSFISGYGLKNQGRFGSGFHAGLDYMAFATEPDTSAEVGVYKDAVNDVWNRGLITPDNAFIYEQYVKTGNNDTDLQKPLLHPLFENDYYVVSENFYSYLNDNSYFDSISYVEWLVARFIKGEAISKNDVAVALQSYDQWSVMHQLYIMPVLWQIARALN